MSTSLKALVQKYHHRHNHARNTRNDFNTTLNKWRKWRRPVPVEQLDRPTIREFLNWVHDRAVAAGGANPGRTANKARSHLLAVTNWACEQDLIESPPSFPKPLPQRDVAGRHYLTKSEINSLYFATHQMRRPRGWQSPLPVGHYWRAALVVFFNYGVDTGTVWGTTAQHEPVLWRNVHWGRCAPLRGMKEESRWGWLVYRRIKTGKVHQCECTSSARLYRLAS